MMTLRGYSYRVSVWVSTSILALRLGSERSVLLGFLEPATRLERVTC